MSAIRNAPFVFLAISVIVMRSKGFEYPDYDKEEKAQKEIHCRMANRHVPSPGKAIKNRLVVTRNKETQGVVVVSWQAIEGPDEYRIYYLPRGLMDAPATPGPLVENSCPGKELMAIITDLDPKTAYTVYIRAERDGKYFAIYSAVDVPPMEIR